MNEVKQKLYNVNLMFIVGLLLSPRFKVRICKIVSWREITSERKESEAVAQDRMLTPVTHGGSAKQSCEYKRTCLAVSFLALTFFFVTKLFLLFLVVNAPPYNNTCVTVYRGKPIKVS